jgi:hypothetical protein
MCRPWHGLSKIITVCKYSNFKHYQELYLRDPWIEIIFGRGTMILWMLRNTALLGPQYGVGSKEIQLFTFNVYCIIFLFPVSFCRINRQHLMILWHLPHIFSSYITEKICLHYEGYLLRVFSEIIAVYSDTHTKPINTFYGQNSGFIKR